MAVAFASLGGFADVIGGGIATEYLAQRTAQPGTSGWTTHAITPPQEPLSLHAAAQQLDPAYEAFSPDLAQAIFRAWSPLTDAPNVAEVENLYVREDLRTPGRRVVPPADGRAGAARADRRGAERPYLAARTDDLAHVLFESRLPLTADATGAAPDALQGRRRRAAAAALQAPAARPLRPADQPCSAAGLGAVALRHTRDTLSADGSRVVLTSPVTVLGGVSSGAEPSHLYQLDDRGTLVTADDTLVQLDASELAVPEEPRAARFQAASADGGRVYFASPARLTEDAPIGGGLYLWQAQPDALGRHLTLVAPGGDDVRAFGASRDGRRDLLRRPRPAARRWAARARERRVPVAAGRRRRRRHDLLRRRAQRSPTRARTPTRPPGTCCPARSRVTPGRPHAAVRGLRRERRRGGARPRRLREQPASARRPASARSCTSTARTSRRRSRPRSRARRASRRVRRPARTRC